VSEVSDHPARDVFADLTSPDGKTAHGFSGTTGRGSVNYMLRNTQQQLVALSGQADLKASILITACSVVLTVGVSQARGSRFVWAFGVLAVFSLVALLGAILCVLPSFSWPRRATPMPPTAPNLLFFGDFAGIDEADFVARLGALSRTDESLYDAQARDIHRQGTYLIRHKFRFLRFGYVAFLLGFVAATFVLVVELVVS